MPWRIGRSLTLSAAGSKVLLFSLHSCRTPSLYAVLRVARPFRAVDEAGSRANASVCSRARLHASTVLLLERGAARVLLAKGLQDGSIGAWLLVDGSPGSAAVSPCQVLQVHQDMVTCMLQVGSWHDARGVFLITGSVDCSVGIRSLGRGLKRGASALRQWAGSPLPPRPKHVLNGHVGAVRCLAASASLDVVVSGDTNGGCLVHTISKGRMLRAFQHPEGLPLLLLQISPGGVIFFCGEGASGVYMTDLHGLVVRHVDLASRRAPWQTRSNIPPSIADVVSTSSAPVSSILLSDDGALLLAGDADGRVLLIDARTLRLLRVLPRTVAGSAAGALCGAVLCMALSPCKNWLVVGTGGGELQVYLSSLDKPSTLPPSSTPPAATTPRTP